MSKELLHVLREQTKYSPQYNFVYDELNRVIINHTSFGHTRVRFVSRNLRKKNINLRHVFLEFQRGIPNKRNNSSYSRMYISEHAPFWSTILEERQEGLFDWEEEISIQLPNIPYGMTEIMAYDKNLPQTYMLGIRDCRHHVCDMLSFCYPIE